MKRPPKIVSLLHPVTAGSALATVCLYNIVGAIRRRSMHRQPSRTGRSRGVRFRFRPHSG